MQAHETASEAAVLHSLANAAEPHVRAGRLEFRAPLVSARATRRAHGVTREARNIVHPAKRVAREHCFELRIWLQVWFASDAEAAAAATRRTARATAGGLAAPAAGAVHPAGCRALIECRLDARHASDMRRLSIVFLNGESNWRSQSSQTLPLAEEMQTPSADNVQLDARRQAQVIQAAFERIYPIATHFHGFLNKVITFDKGTLMILLYSM